MAIRRHWIGLPTSMHGKSHASLPRRLANGLPRPRIQISLVPSGARLLVGKPLEGIEILIQRVIKRLGWSAGPASRLVANVNHTLNSPDSFEWCALDFFWGGISSRVAVL